MEAPKNIYPLAPPPNNSRFCRRRYPVTDWNIALLVGVCMRLIISFWSLFITGATITSWMYYFILQPFNVPYDLLPVEFPCLFMSPNESSSIISWIIRFTLFLQLFNPSHFELFDYRVLPYSFFPLNYVSIVRLTKLISIFFSKFPSSPFLHIYR